MAPGQRVISQEAFDSLVRENEEEFGMSAEEAVEDAIATLCMQGADLTGISTTWSAAGQRQEHPAAAAATQLKEALVAWEGREGGGGAGDNSSEEFSALLLALSALRQAVDTAHQSEEATSDVKDGEAEGEVGRSSGNLQEGDESREGGAGAAGRAAAGGAEAGGDAAGGVAAAGPSESAAGEAAVVAGRNEGMQSAVGALRVLLGAVGRGEEGEAAEEGKERVDQGMCDALRCTELLMACVPSARDEFFRLSAPSALASALASSSFTRLPLFAAAARTVRAACTENEVNKEAFMDGGVHVAILNAIGRIVQIKGTADVDKSGADVAGAGSAMCACCGALRALVTNDDMRVAASKTFTNARTVAEAGAAEVLLRAAGAFDADVAVLPAVLAALKAVAVNEDICRSIASAGGVAVVLSQLRLALSSHCSPLASPSAALLAQLAGSDANKALIVETGGVLLLVEAVKVFVDDGDVLQQVLGCLAAITLRSPSHAAAAVAAGVLDATAEAMEGRGATAGSQWQASQLLRNLAVRNPEHRPIMVEMGFEAILRKVKAKHRSCRDVCSAALRDMGLDNYNR